VGRADADLAWDLELRQLLRNVFKVRHIGVRASEDANEAVSHGENGESGWCLF